jgi:Starch/carbohydrate-binding module (family 53)
MIKIALSGILVFAALSAYASHPLKPSYQETSSRVVICANFKSMKGQYFGEFIDDKSLSFCRNSISNQCAVYIDAPISQGTKELKMWIRVNSTERFLNMQELSGYRTQFYTEVPCEKNRPLKVQFAFTNGKTWDNNEGDDYSAEIP